LINDVGDSTKNISQGIADFMPWIGAAILGGAYFNNYFKSPITAHSHWVLKSKKPGADVKPGFIESWFEKSNSFQWVCNGRPFSSWTASEAILLESPASRNLAASAYWNLISLDQAASIVILSKGDTQIFTGAREPYGNQQL
jgi:hypothetical protein